MDIRELEATRKRDRARLLLQIYEETGGNTHALCKVYGAAKAIGIEGEEAETAYVNLVSAGYLIRLIPSAPGPFVVQITQDGVNQVEANREFPPKNLKETMEARQRFLEEVYRKTDGRTTSGVSTYEGVGQPLGFDDDTTAVMAPYLEYCGLVETSRMGRWISLTEVGLKFITDGPESLQPGGVTHVTLNFVIAHAISNTIIQQAGDGARQYATKPSRGSDPGGE